MKRLSTFALVAIVTAAASIQSARAADIVDTAVSAGSFKTLAAALQAAELVDTLKGEGPFTVFAPTDDAFAKLPEGTVETLLKPENRDKLTGILTYHVVPGKVGSKQVVSLKGAKTANGQRVDIKIDGDKVYVDNAQVVKTDIDCDNGVIHVIDSVILPASDNIPTTAVNAGKFNTLVAAVKAAGLVDAISGEGPFTVFAPTDDAFKKLPEGTVESLLKPENRDKLTAILKYHIIPGRVYSEDAAQAKSAKTLQGQPINISVSGSKARINESNLIATDIDASNGVIHVIDSVLLPPEKVGAAEGRRMIEHAIARGAPIFNAGHHAQCAEIYTSTMRELVERGESMPEEIMTSLRSTMAHAQSTGCPTQRAWTLRHGLDRVYYAMYRMH
jgi:uncharacterized surface protein with fasciclin (FAS1) repeats